MLFIYNIVIFKVDKNNWFNYCPYNNGTGGYGYVQNSGFITVCLKTIDCLDAVFSASGSRVQNQWLKNHEKYK